MPALRTMRRAAVRGRAGTFAPPRSLPQHSMKPVCREARGRAAARALKQGFQMRLWLVLAFVSLLAIPARAQDALTVAPDVYKRAFENERMRVLEGSLRPKSKADWHSHPEHLFYMLTEGTLVFQAQGKKPYEMSFAAGQTLLLPAQTSAIENDSDKPVRFLVVELKGGRAAPGAQSVAATKAAPRARPAAAKSRRASRPSARGRARRRR